MEYVGYIVLGLFIVMVVSRVIKSKTRPKGEGKYSGGGGGTGNQTHPK